MTVFLELLLLLVALAAIVVLGLDSLKAPLRRRREREYLERLRGADDDEEEDDDEPPPAGRLRQLLVAAGAGIGALPFLLLSVALGLVACLALLSLSSRAWAAAVLLGLLAAYLPWVALRELGRWRGWRFEERLVEAVEFMAAALAAGENPTRALRTAAEASREPVRGELRAVADRLDAGVGVERALDRLRRRRDSEGTRLFTQTLMVKWQAGGDLASLLRAVAEVMREQIRITLRLRSELAGVQIAAVIVAVIPYLMIPFFLAMRPTWAPSLLGHPLGPALLGLAVAAQLVGFFWLRRILRVEL